MLEKDLLVTPKAQLPSELLQMSQDPLKTAERNRQGSFLTDKDPSYIQPNEATYSDVGGGD